MVLKIKKKVYNPKPQFTVTGKDSIDIWNQLYFHTTISNIDEVYKSEEWQVLAKYGLLKNKKKILEAGCGDGRWVRALYKLNISVYGIDFAVNGLKVIKDSCPEANIVQGDIRYLPFRNGIFDLILSWGVMEHFENVKEIDVALQESYRCLKSGGVLVVSVPYLSINRLLNPQVVARRFASRFNWLRKIFNKGEKLFFQYEFSIQYFKDKIISNGFRIVHH